MADVKVSIVLPVYNAAATLKECIGSLTGQTLKEIEIICVDDRSTDASLDILKSLQVKDDRIKVISNSENLGTLRTRKVGVEAAQGEYLMFCDNDDRYELNACEELYEEIKKRNVDILMYDIRRFHYDEEGKYVEVPQKWINSKPEEYCGETCLGVENRIALLWNKIITADVCRKAYAATENLFLTIAEDTYACFLIHYYAKSFSTIQKVYYNWNNKTGISNRETMTLEQFENLCRCVKDYYSALEGFFNTHENAEENIKQLEEKGTTHLYCIKKWRDALSVEQSVLGMDIILKYYTREQVLDCIHTLWNSNQDKYENLRVKYRSLKKKYNSVINSRSWKLTQPLRRKYVIKKR